MECQIAVEHIAACQADRSLDIGRDKHRRLFGNTGILRYRSLDNVVVVAVGDRSCESLTLFLSECGAGEDSRGYFVDVDSVGADAHIDPQRLSAGARCKGPGEIRYRAVDNKLAVAYAIARVGDLDAVVVESHVETLDHVFQREVRGHDTGALGLDMARRTPFAQERTRFAVELEVDALGSVVDSVAAVTAQGGAGKSTHTIGGKSRIDGSHGIHGPQQTLRRLARRRRMDCGGNVGFAEARAVEAVGIAHAARRELHVELRHTSLIAEAAQNAREVDVSQTYARRVVDRFEAGKAESGAGADGIDLGGVDA